MKISLIRPSFGNRIAGAYIPSNRIQPLALANIAGLTGRNHELIFFDDRIEPIDYEANTDLVAISVETHTARRSYEIAKRFRKTGVPVVMGGFHPTLIPEEVSEYADSVVIGEAESVWAQILQDVGKKALKKYYKPERRYNLIGINPNRDIFRNKRYMPLIPVEFGRGCKYSCDFCAVGAFYEGKYLHRPVKEVISELKNLDKKNLILFTDDNIIADPPAAKELFNAITPLGIRWVGQASMEFAQDAELLHLAAKSGCTCLLIGFESLSKDNLVRMKKTSNLRSGDWMEIVAKIRNAGIRIYGTFIFGYDADTATSFKDTLKFALQNKFFIANFNHLVPYPGTSLYKRLFDENRLIYKKWWLDEDYYYGGLAFNPVSVSPAEIEKGCNSVKAEFNSVYNILCRACDLKANTKDLKNLSEFLMCNMLSYREITMKRNMRLINERSR